MQQKNESTMICGINPPIRTNVSVACFCLGAFSFWSYVHQSVDGWGANVNHHLLAKVATRECFTANDQGLPKVLTTFATKCVHKTTGCADEHIAVTESARS